MSILPAILSRNERRAALRQLARDNAAMPGRMQPVRPEHWPEAMRGVVSAVFRSRHFLAQLFVEAGGVMRLSVNRTTTDPQGVRWVDGITWDELQRVKTECGFGDQWAVEVYPPDGDVVNVANVRHLWLLPEAPEFAWRRKA